MLWIFFLMRQVFLNLQSTRKQRNSGFPLTTVHGVGQHWCSQPRGKPSYEFNSEVSSKIMSTGAHKCHSWAKTWGGEKEAKKCKSRKNMKLKKKKKNKTRNKEQVSRKASGFREQRNAIRHQSPRSQFIYDYLMWWPSAVHTASHPTASTGVE